jgi:hypothetical protein
VSPGDLANVNTSKGNKLLNHEVDFATKDGWKEATLSVPIPCTGHGSESGVAGAAQFEVLGFFRWHILPVMVSFFESAWVRSVHFTPFKQFVKRASGVVKCVYSKLYNTTAWLDEHTCIPAANTDNPMEKVIAAIMLYSDSTRLTQFGTKLLWPIYLFWGNQSKYDREQLSTFSAHHIGYIPPVSA